MKPNHLFPLLILAILASGTVGVIGTSIVHAESALASGKFVAENIEVIWEPENENIDVTFKLENSIHITPIWILSRQDNHVVKRGPSTRLNVGDSELFTAILVYSDGSTKDVTPDATWELSDSTVGFLYWVATPPFTLYRVFAAENIGQTTLTASYHGLSDNIELTVENLGEVFVPDNNIIITWIPENENIVIIEPENFDRISIITFEPENWVATRWAATRRVEDVEIKIVGPNYLQPSTADRIPNTLDVYARRAGSGGLLKVDIEIGIKIRFPGPLIYVFMDVDVEILGTKRFDVLRPEWLVKRKSDGDSALASLYQEYAEGVEEGYVGINAFVIPSESLQEGVEVESLPEEGWGHIGSENIFVVRDPQTPHVQFLFPSDVLIGPIEFERSENLEIGIEGENIRIVPSESYFTIRLGNIKSTVGIGPVLIGPSNFITVGDVRMEPAWSGEPLALATVPRLKAGSPMRIEFGEGDVTEIGVNVTGDIEDVVITLQQSTSKPADIPAGAPDHVYRYLHLATNAGSEIGSVSFIFKVEKSWLHANNIDELTVALNRFSGGGWEPLPTEKAGEDPTHVYYSAESHGLSVFAITGREEVPPSEPVSWALIGGLVAIAAIIGIMALYRRRH